MEKKYIIELPEKYILEGDNGSKYLQIPVADSNRELIIRSTMPLTPYTEPDTEAIEKEAYQRGLNDAWEAAKKNYLPEDHGGLLGYKTRMKVFGTDNIGWIFNNLSASEAIEKIRAYEEKKKAEQEIKVGDWVQNGGVIGVVTYIEQTNDGICYHVLGEDGHLWYLDDTVTKKYKGRVPKEIAGFLKKVEADE